MTSRRVLPTLLLAAALVASASGCIGQDGEEPVGEGRSPQEAMELAKETLDEAEGVQVDLYAVDLPQDFAGNALVSASGTMVRPDSFEGDAKARVSGFDVDAQLKAIGDDFWVKAPVLGPDWQRIDPATYGIPDPADLLATEGGLSDLLPQTQDLEEGEEIRGGENNEEVLTQYTGVLPGDAVQEVVPIARGGDFDMEYLVAADGELREFRITGQFYDQDELTYVVNLDDYGTTREIRAP